MDVEKEVHVSYVVDICSVDYRWSIEHNPRPHGELSDPKQTFFVAANPLTHQRPLEQVLENSEVLAKLPSTAVRIYPRTKRTSGNGTEDGFNVELRSAKAAGLTFTELLAHLVELLDSAYSKS